MQAHYVPFTADNVRNKYNACKRTVEKKKVIALLEGTSQGTSHGDPAQNAIGSLSPSFSSDSPMPGLRNSAPLGAMERSNCCTEGFYCLWGL